MFESDIKKYVKTAYNYCKRFSNFCRIEYKYNNLFYLKLKTKLPFSMYGFILIQENNEIINIFMNKKLFLVDKVIDVVLLLFTKCINREY